MNRYLITFSDGRTIAVEAVNVWQALWDQPDDVISAQQINYTTGAKADWPVIAFFAVVLAAIVICFVPW